jgi:hypothetical protein
VSPAHLTGRIVGACQIPVEGGPFFCGPAQVFRLELLGMVGVYRAQIALLYHRRLGVWKVEPEGQAVHRSGILEP